MAGKFFFSVALSLLAPAPLSLSIAAFSLLGLFLVVGKPWLPESVIKYRMEPRKKEGKRAQRRKKLSSKRVKCGVSHHTHVGRRPPGPLTGDEQRFSPERIVLQRRLDLLPQRRVMAHTRAQAHAHTAQCYACFRTSSSPLAPAAGAGGANGLLCRARGRAGGCETTPSVGVFITDL